MTSAGVGAAKPARAIFEHALALAGAAPERALHVGDSPEEDVAGASACGIPVVLVRREAHERMPGPAGVAAIATLAELNWA